MRSALQRAVFAEDSVLSQFQCSATSSPHIVKTLEGDHCPIMVTDAQASSNDILVHSSGWKFYSFHRHILHDQEIKNFIAAIKDQLYAQSSKLIADLSQQGKTLEAWKQDEHLLLEGFNLHVPPMLFGADVMLLQCPSGDALTVSALDAIYSWVIQVISIDVSLSKQFLNDRLCLLQHSAERIAQKPLNVPKVPFSHGWMASMRSQLESSRVYPTSPVHKDVLPILPDEAAILNAVRAYDWTFSNDYCVTVLSKEASSSDPSSLRKAIVNARDASSLHLPALLLNQSGILPASSESMVGWTVRKDETCLIDYDMLKRRDLPILFYDEMTLYQVG